jgi:hypothetical protein
MIKFNDIYIINNGQESIVFKEGKGNTISGEYNDGTLTGTLEGDVLKATFHNKKTNSAGLIEFEFNENGFSAKWKQGVEEGPMRGKWEGKLEENIMKDNSESGTFILIVDGYEIEVSGKNLEKELVWADILEYCQALGNGWRLPNFNELNEVFKNLADNKIGDFERSPYWSSDEIDNEFSRGIIMSIGVETSNWRLNEAFFRPVRNKFN